MNIFSRFSNYIRNTSEINQRFMFSILMIAIIGMPILLGGKIFTSMLIALCVLVVSEYVAIIKAPKPLTLLFIMVEFIGFNLMRESEFGLHKIMFIAFIIACFDTTAYFVGKAIGKHKLCPNISPGKTIEGFLGGIICTIALSLPIYYILGCKVQLNLYFWIVAVLAVLSQIGDIMESKFKRQYGVKDSSTLIPGHGGVLDRFDGYILVLPAFFAIELLFKILNITLF